MIPEAISADSTAAQITIPTNTIRSGLSTVGLLKIDPDPLDPGSLGQFGRALGEARADILRDEQFIRWP